MTYDAERATLGRKPVLLCEVELDRCANVYGQAAAANLLSDPDDFSAWTGAATVTTNSDTAPDGSVSADTVEDASGAAAQLIADSAALDLTETYFFSVFVKKDATPRSTRFAGIDLNFGIGGSVNEFNRLAFATDTGVFSITNSDSSNVAGDVESISDDYWLVHLQAVNVAGSNDTVHVNIFPALGAGTSSWSVNVATTGSIVAWGARLAEGTVLTDRNMATCAAAGAAGSECYNTRQTCQDPANFTQAFLPFTIRFSDVFVPGLEALPALHSAELAPTVIDPKKGLGVRASINLVLHDFPHHDRGLDPYVSGRSYTPESQGTFFGKLLARHRHYAGRPLRIKSGYLAATGFDSADFQTRNYVIDNIGGPDQNGRVTISAKDVLKLADDKRAEAPEPSTGKLVSSITAAATSLTVTSGTESEYSAEGDYLRIGDEVIQAPVANRSANVFSNLTRGAFGTEAAEHDAGDGVQACKHLNAVGPLTLAKDLLENYADIPTAYIDATAWSAEETLWYSTATINTLITEPTGVTKLLNDLAEQYFFQIWWNEIDQLINVAAVVPPAAGATIPELTDENHFIADSVKVMRDEERRLTRVLMYYDPITPIEAEAARDFKGFSVQILADEESASLYGDTRLKVIKAQFIDSDAIAVQTASRWLSRFGDVPRDIEFKIDAKDIDIWTGDVIDVNTVRLQDETGANAVQRAEVLSVKEITNPASGSHFQIKALESTYQARYGYIGPDTLNDYDAETAGNKASYGFIAPDAGTFTSDNQAAYRII